MATAHAPESSESVEHSHPEWARHFSADERAQMMKEDAFAFGIVSAELVAIVSLGFFLVALTLCAIVLKG